MKTEIRPADVTFTDLYSKAFKIAGIETQPDRRILTAVLRLESETVLPSTVSIADEDLEELKQQIVANLISKIYGDLWRIGEMIEGKADTFTIQEMKIIGRFLRTFGQTTDDAAEPFNTDPQFSDGRLRSDILRQLLQRSALPKGENADA